MTTPLPHAASTLSGLNSDPAKPLPGLTGCPRVIWISRNHHLAAPHIQSPAPQHVRMERPARLSPYPLSENQSAGGQTGGGKIEDTQPEAGPRPQPHLLHKQYCPPRSAGRPTPHAENLASAAPALRHGTLDWSANSRMSALLKKTSSNSGVPSKYLVRLDKRGDFCRIVTGTH